MTESWNWVDNTSDIIRRRCFGSFDSAITFASSPHNKRVNLKNWYTRFQKRPSGILWIAVCSGICNAPVINVMLSTNYMYSQRRVLLHHRPETIFSKITTLFHVFFRPLSTVTTSQSVLVHTTNSCLYYNPCSVTTYEPVLTGMNTLNRVVLKVWHGTIWYVW